MSPCPTRPPTPTAPTCTRTSAGLLSRRSGAPAGTLSRPTTSRSRAKGASSGPRCAARNPRTRSASPCWRRLAPRPPVRVHSIDARDSCTTATKGHEYAQITDRVHRADRLRVDRSRACGDQSHLDRARHRSYHRRHHLAREQYGYGRAELRNMQASFVPGDAANDLLHRSAERHARSAECFRQHQRPALPVMVCGRGALADDSEIFTGSASAGAQPNILLILDTSGSMASTVITQAPYDPATTYAGSCSSTLVYFQASAGSAPTGCSGLSSFSTSYQKCQSAVNSLTNPGFYTDQFLQWKFKSPKYSWSNTVGGANRYDVACQGDYSSTAPFPTTYNGTSNIAANEWTNTANAANSYWAQSGATGGGYTLYSANYLNYLASNPPVVAGTRISVVQQAATNLINSLSNVNIGLMRYSNNISAPVGPVTGNAADGYAAGGMVAYPVSPVATNR